MSFPAGPTVNGAKTAKSSLLAVNRVAFYLARMGARGIPAGQVLAGTELQPEQVQGVFRGTPAHYRTIIANMLRLTGDPFLGIALGDEFRISDFGVLGYAILSSATLRQSRSVMAEYYTLNEHIIRPDVTIDERRWCIEISETFPLGRHLPFAVEEYVSRATALACTLTNQPFPVKSLHLAYAAPADLTAYRRRFDCPMYFDQPKTLVHFDVARLETPISLANEEVFRVCERQCHLTADRIAGGSSLATQIRDALIGAPGEFPTMDAMAQRLKTTPRTLRRRLVGEGISYQKILDETRKDLARQYLEYTRLTPKEIAFLLGYSDVSNFRRAFRSWTGRRISDYR
ncbi:MAG: putative HTH-type transcriptional regulator [Steroidobacteraceae bacterium]|nr:putative HTH-type transcriptional regulator [Steroidobacteraceae bacterium]